MRQSKNGSTRQLGYERNNVIIELLEQYTVLTAENIRDLMFSDIDSGLRVAQRKLKALVDKGIINKKRDDLTLKYYYYIGDVKQVAHISITNDVFFEIKNNLENWEKIYCYNRETDYTILRADGFVGIENKLTSERRFIFIEADRSNNKFDKVTLYNELFEQDHSKFWWSKYAKRFPEIYVRTFREKAVQKAIDKDNRNGLRFKIV